MLLLSMITTTYAHPWEPYYWHFYVNDKEIGNWNINSDSYMVDRTFIDLWDWKYWYSYVLLKSDDSIPEQYLVLDWKKYWPYSIETLFFNIKKEKDWWYSFMYEKDWKIYKNKNGIDFIFLKNASYSSFSESPWEEENYYSYKVYFIKYSENNKVYLYLDWKEYWPYDKLPSYIYYNNSKSWFKFVYEKWNQFYKNINWEISGPYNKYPQIINYSHSIKDNTNNIYKKWNKSYTKLNNKEYWPYDSINVLWENTVIWWNLNSKEQKIYIYVNWKLVWKYFDSSIKKDNEFNTNSLSLDCMKINKLWVVCRYSVQDYNHKGYLILTNKYLWLKQEIKENILNKEKIDKVLDKYFTKIEKKGKNKAILIYKIVIKRIDSLIKKTNNPKKKELLEYIKNEFETRLTTIDIFELLNSQ